MINRFVFVSAHFTFAIFWGSYLFLLLIYFVLIALSCAAVMRDSVSLLRFPLFSHNQDFTCAISAVCRLKYPYSCFSSHFCFLVFVVFPLVHMLQLLFLAATISFSLLFCVYSSSAWIVASTQSSMLTRPLTPSFLRHIACLCRLSLLLSIY